MGKRDISKLNLFKKKQYSLIEIIKNKCMKIDGGKIIFGLGVSSAVATAVIALYFSIR